MNTKLKKLNNVILVYARLNSKRLPNKVLIKINSKTILSLVIERIKIISKYKIPIVVCSSNNKSDDKLINYCKRNHINFFRGSLNNVFSRTVMCLKLINIILNPL